MAPNFQQLFLFDIFLKKLQVKGGHHKKDIDNAGGIIAAIKLNPLPCFELKYELELDTEANKDEVSDKDSLDEKDFYIINKGKSCTFSMDPADLSQALSDHPLLITLDTLEKGEEPRKMIGSAEVRIYKIY